MPRPLPTELIRHIIKLSLPVVSHDTCKERYDLLLAFSLVNSTWNALAQEELHKDVFVETGVELIAVLEGKEGQQSRRVHLGTASEQRPHIQLQGYTTALSGVKSLSLSHMYINANDWPAFDELETLHMYRVNFGPGWLYLPVPPLPDGCLFRSLTTLSLLNTLLYGGFHNWTTWLTRSNLPKLRRLTIGLLDVIESLGADNDFVEAVELLAPQIQCLTVTEGYFDAWFISNFPWSAFTSIRRLALRSQVGDLLALINAALAELPAPTLTHLLVGYGHDVVDEELRSLGVWVTEILPTLMRALEVGSEVDSLRALEVLVLHYGSEVIKRDTWDQSSKLEAVMKARGGQLDRRALEGQSKQQALWETYLEPW